jgi:hypothetical protein
MEAPDALPKVGDRVCLSNHSRIFVVAQVDEQHHSVTLAREVVETQAPIHEIAIQAPEAK